MKKNFELGNKVYLEILERKPELALINEQAFSAGTVDVLKKAKFKAIIMDWNIRINSIQIGTQNLLIYLKWRLGLQKKNHYPYCGIILYFFKSFKDMFMEKSKSMTF